MTELVGKIDPNAPRKPGDLTIYGLIPTDVPSLREPNGQGSKGGKVGAHGVHCGNQILLYTDHPDVKLYIEDGKANGAKGFNTCTTLDATTKQIEMVITAAKAMGYVADIVVDPTYPWFVDIETARFLDPTKVQVVWEVKQGDKVLCMREQITFGWVLGTKTDPMFRYITSMLKLAE
jgi:hypothetical protein